MKIAIAGTGYVCLSHAVLLAQHNTVVALDLIADKVDMLNKRLSPIQDTEIEHFLQHKEPNLTATLEKKKRLSYFPIPIWPCGFLILMSLTLTQRALV
jgi:UDPglucose 6-dehydrogenase